jgi:hypothetical protein
MQVIFGRRPKSKEASKQEVVYIEHWTKGIASDPLSYFFLFIVFGMFGLV